MVGSVACYDIDVVVLFPRGGIFFFYLFFYLQLLSSDSGFTYSSCARVNRGLLVAVAIGDEPNQSWAGIGVGNILWYGSGLGHLWINYFFFFVPYKFALAYFGNWGVGEKQELKFLTNYSSFNFFYYSNTFI